MNYIKCLSLVLLLLANVSFCSGQIFKPRTTTKYKPTPTTRTQPRFSGGVKTRDLGDFVCPKGTQNARAKGIKAANYTNGKTALQVSEATLLESRNSLSSTQSRLSFSRIENNPKVKDVSKKPIKELKKTNKGDVKKRSNKFVDYTKMYGEARKTALKNAIGERSYNEIAKAAPNKNISEILAKDLTDNPNLCEHLKRDPNIAKAYGQAVESRLRTDIKTLRWISNHSNVFADSRPGFSKKYGSGDMVKLVDGKNGDVFIFDRNTGDLLGTINKDCTIVYVNPKNPTLLNIGLMRNMKYIVKETNTVYTTDNYGICIKSEKTYPANNHEIDIAERNGNETKYIKSAKQAKDTRVSDKDQGGHTIGLSVGGSNDVINIDPQNGTLNDGPYKSFERSVANIVKDPNNQGKIIKYTVEKTYPEPKNGRLSYRPSTYKCTVTVDGVVVKQETFVNTFEM